MLLEHGLFRRRPQSFAGRTIKFCRHDRVRPASTRRSLRIVRSLLFPLLQNRVCAGDVVAELRDLPDVKDFDGLAARELREELFPVRTDVGAVRHDEFEQQAVLTGTCQGNPADLRVPRRGSPRGRAS